MPHPTKILPYDLDIEFQTLLDELREINEDLKKAETDSGKQISERLQAIERSVISLDIDQINMGNYNIQYEYDGDDVVKETVTGDRNYETIYSYVNEADESGQLVTKLSESVKTFTNPNGDLIKIKEVYTHTGDNITGIQKSTEITPA